MPVNRKEVMVYTSDSDRDENVHRRVKFSEE
jgi:hypothetical protein